MIELNNAIWLFVVIFMLHDFEELITVENWAQRTESRIQTKLERIIWTFWNIDSYTFAKRDVIIFSAMSSITFLRTQFMASNWISVMYIAFLVFVLLHNAVHIFQTIILRVYTPGLYTSIFLVTPYALYLFFRVVF